MTKVWEVGRNCGCACQRARVCSSVDVSLIATKSFGAPHDDLYTERYCAHSSLVVLAEGVIAAPLQIRLLSSAGQVADHKTAFNAVQRFFYGLYAAAVAL